MIQFTLSHILYVLRKNLLNKTTVNISLINNKYIINEINCYANNNKIVWNEC